MMPTKQLNSNVVTTIADNDLVTVADSQGQLRPISFANLMSAVRSRIQVGGRNLIPCTTYSNDISGAVATKGKKLNPNSRIVFTNAPIKNAGIYAVSFWVKADSATHMYVDINDCGQTTVQIGTEWEYRSVCINVTQFIGTYGFLDLSTTAAMTDKVYISDIVVVEGNIPAKDWFPAPEDIASGAWGGVIGCYAINYNSAEKGGAHDADQNACGSARLCADSHLAFGSLDDMCRFLGQSEEAIVTDTFIGSPILHECGRRSIGMVKSKLHHRKYTESGLSCLRGFYPYNAVRLHRKDSGISHMDESSNDLRSQKNIWVGSERMGAMGKDCPNAIARKEVAYVAD